ncbi:MAG TPA: hypothetical protein VFX53_01885 [Pedococcus sp.]|nr:hypothetical protein [Pedococcus sp.]
MTSQAATAAPSPADPALFAALIDDAAVFPPGLAALPDAVREHRAHRASGYAALIGPLLVPASSAAEVLGLLPPGANPLRIGLIVRPGTPLHTVTDAAHLLHENRQVEVAAVEVGWAPEWRDLDLLDLTGDATLVLEVPRGHDQERALDDIAAEAADGTRVLAKFRTGATPAWDWPDEQELAAFLVGAAERGLPFKLTGGLHHAVRGSHTVHGHSEEQHGLLNVLVGVAVATVAPSPDRVAEVLAQRDPAPLVREVAALGPHDVARVRRLFTSYGCCGVTDPVAELSALHLIEET